MTTAPRLGRGNHTDDMRHYLVLLRTTSVAALAQPSSDARPIAAIAHTRFAQP